MPEKKETSPRIENFERNYGVEVPAGLDEAGAWDFMRNRSALMQAKINAVQEKVIDLIHQGEIEEAAKNRDILANAER